MEPVEIYLLEPGSFHSHCPATLDPKVEDRLAGSDLTGCRSGSSSYGVWNLEIKIIIIIIIIIIDTM